MRAVKAARDDGKGELLDNLLQVSLPLLKSLIDELLVLREGEESQKRGSTLALWMLESCNAPPDLLSSLRSWDAKRTTNGICQQPQAPQDTRSKVEESPKKKAVREANAVDRPAPEFEFGHQLTESVPEDEELEAPPEPVPDMDTMDRAADTMLQKRKQRQSVMWKRNSQLTDTKIVAPLKVDCDEEDKEKSPIGAQLVSPKRSMRRSNSGHGSMLNTRKRRFTVSLTSQQLGMPPRMEALRMLRNVPAFADYSEEDLHKIADVATCKKYEVDENIVVHGAPADNLHIVVEGFGKVSALSQVGTIKTGEFFGEDALRLSASTNPTQVSAVGGPITTLSIAASAFQNLDIRRPHMSKRGKGLTACKKHNDDYQYFGSDEQKMGLCEDSGREILVGVTPTLEERDVIKLAVTNNQMLGEVLQLTDEQCMLIADSVHAIRLSKGEVLFSRGANAFAFYIIRDGLMDVLIDGVSSTDVHLKSGCSFGELALLYDSPRSATLKCAKECTLWVLPRNSFKHVMACAFKQRIKEYSDLIGKIPAIAGTFGSNNLDMLADVIEEVTVLQGEFLCEEGVDDGQIFVIYSGECEMERGDQVIRLCKGDWVGEEQVLNGGPAAFSCRVTSEELTALVLDHANLLTVASAQRQVKSLQTLEGMSPWCSESHLVKEKFADSVLQDRVSDYMMHEKEGKDKKPNMHSMTRLGTLGEGSFGSVVLLKDAETSELYALKALRKDHIAEEKMQTHICNERSVMSVLDSDFIVRLHASYHDPEHVFFLLEPVFGGELFDVYTEKSLFGNFTHARFYIACVTLALEHMHTKRVIYRDLKLENCLLDKQGYVKLTDMGIAKMVLGKTYTICGTADYFAPETLRQTGHNRAVDWWACGVLLFIMAVGRSPFDAEDVTQIYKNIVKGFSKVKFPQSVTSDLSDVIKSLCRKKPEERVPMQKGGVDGLKDMPWFSSLSWHGLQERSLEGPLLPERINLDKIAAKKLSRDFAFDAAGIHEWDGNNLDQDHGMTRTASMINTMTRISDMRKQVSTTSATALPT